MVTSILALCGNSGNCSVYSFFMVTSLYSGSFFSDMHILAQPETQGNPSVDFLSFLSANSTLTHKFLQPWPLCIFTSQGPLHRELSWFPLSCNAAQNCLLTISWYSCSTGFVCYPFVRNHSALISVVQYLCGGQLLRWPPMIPTFWYSRFEWVLDLVTNKYVACVVGCHFYDYRRLQNTLTSILLEHSLSHLLDEAQGTESSLWPTARE